MAQEFQLAEATSPSLCEYILMMWPDNIGFHVASDLPADPKHESMVKGMNAVQLDCMHLAVAQAQVQDGDPDDEMDVQQVAVTSPGDVHGKSSILMSFQQTQ